MATLNCNDPSLPMRNQDQSRPEEASPPSHPKTMEDLPPELVTKILEFVTLDGNKKNMLSCRIVNSQWNEIMDPIIENGICSDQFEAFPEMRTAYVETADVDDDGLQVRVCPTRFPDGTNPFPFNSLQIRGATSRYDSEDSQVPLLSLKTFASRFGGNLTTFILRGVCFHSFNTLPVLLRSMPNLKRLSLLFVRLIIDAESLIDIPTASPLPNLTFLDLKSAMGESVDDILFVWLMGSYADQLDLLRLDVNFEVPPLLRSYQYSYPLRGGEERLVVTTAENAFENLKELTISDPNREFLELSETPVLQRFVINEVETNLAKGFNLGDVAFFIDNCSSTLETINLNFSWDGMENEEAFRNYLEEHHEAEFPRLKTVFIYYPSTDLQETMLSAFLLKFPALRTLYLLRFRVHHFDEEIPVEQLQNRDELGNGNKQNNEEIAALKDRLAVLRRQIREIQITKKTASTALDALLARRYVRPEEYVQRRQVNVQVQQLYDTVDSLLDAREAAIEERAQICRRLAPLRVQQLLERGRFWDTFPNLTTVSVSSSAEEAEEDVYVVRRTDAA